MDERSEYTILAETFKRIDEREKKDKDAIELRIDAVQAGQGLGNLTDQQNSRLDEITKNINQLIANLGERTPIVTQADLELYPDQPLLLASPREDA